MFTSNLVVFEETYKDKGSELDGILKSENIKIKIQELLNIK
jgi:hypothetical protein